MESLTILYSTVTDGSMKMLTNDQARAITYNRRGFLTTHNIKMEDTTLVRLVYKGTDYCRYKMLTDGDKGDGMIRKPSFVADAMVVTKPGHALFLPLADCIGAVIHDPVKNILMLSHLGRHNLEQFGGTKSIEYLTEQFQCDPKNLTVWLSPAAGGESYPLFAFEHRSLREVATKQLLAAGVNKDSITSSSIDVTKDSAYFSHSEFLKGNRLTDGRLAVVAIMN